MLYTIPDYYNEFSCIAGDCPDTCCAGWQIVIDEKSQKKYKNIRGISENVFGSLWIGRKVSFVKTEKDVLF